MNDNSFYVGDYNQNLYLKISGEITMYNVYPLKNFLESLNFSNCKHIIFDFQNTRHLDSTSLGTIAATGLKYLKSCNKKLTFINVSKELESNLINLGFKPIAEMGKEVGMEITEESLIPLPGKKEKISGKEILEAHKSLANLNEKNRAIFKNVIELLEKEL